MMHGFASLSSKIKTAYNEIGAMKRLILLATLVTIHAILAGSLASDSGASLAEGDVVEDDKTVSQIESSNSSASAGITITMTGVMNE